MSVPDLLRRKATHFVLWRPDPTVPPPRLIIGRFQSGNPPALTDQQIFDLRPSAGVDELWELPAAECGLADGVYHYWFDVTDTNPYRDQRLDGRIACTDPTAWTVDWRLRSPRRGAAAGVVRWAAGQLSPCDPGGETVDWDGDSPLGDLPANNHLVIYELPTTWARRGGGALEVAVGTFRDVLALIDADHGGANFATTPALAVGRAYLQELGVNAVELLPPADSFLTRGWGYATSNYFAADFDLGFPEGHASPTATQDLAALIKLCHQNRMRFFCDMVMAFSRMDAYRNVNFLDFHVDERAQSPDPELWMARCNGTGTRRNGWSGDLFKYGYWVTGYDPVSGRRQSLVPARQLMQTYLARWMLDFRIDGIRIDSVENIGKMDFVRQFTDAARALWHARCEAQGLPGTEAGARFLVVGEELSLPLCLLDDRYVDALWNEQFKRLVRCAIMGQTPDDEPTFERTVRKLIDCRELGFRDGAQVINYLTSHDVEGWRNERLYNLLRNNRIVETEQRIKLAFVCLLTAVGIPMILAGEEFADEHDHQPTGDGGKETDPVNFDRLEEPWRRRIFEYVARLVRLRTTSGALAVNDTTFLHVDFNDGKRVLVWQRGQVDRGDLVVVVANFSDWATANPHDPHATYVVPYWPATPPGKRWREVTQERDVPADWIGREPLYPWEAKVYVTAGD